MLISQEVLMEVVLTQEVELELLKMELLVILLYLLVVMVFNLPFQELLLTMVVVVEVWALEVEHKEALVEVVRSMSMTV